MPIVDKNTTQAGAYITRDNLHWGSTLGVPQGPISFGFRTSAPGYSVSGENVQGTFTAFSAAEQAAARAALNLWASIANITFTDLGIQTTRPSSSLTIPRLPTSLRPLPSILP